MSYTSNKDKIIGVSLDSKMEIDPVTKDIKLGRSTYHLSKKLQNRLTCPISWFYWNEEYGSILASLGDFRYPLDVGILTRIITSTIREEPAVKSIVQGSIEIWYDNSQTELFYSMDLVLNSINNEIIKIEGSTSLNTSGDSPGIESKIKCL
jgi:hypothetical protein